MCFVVVVPDITVIIVITQTQCKSWAMIYVDNLLSTQDITLA